MSKVVALSHDGVKRVSKNVANAPQNEIGGKAMTDFDARIADIKELARTNPERALEEASALRGNLEGERHKTGIKSALLLVAGLGLSTTAPAVAAVLGAASVLYAASKLKKIKNKESVAGRAFFALSHFVHGRFDKNQMNELLGIDTKKTKQSVNPSSKEVKAKPNNNKGNTEDKEARKSLGRNNLFLKNKNQKTL